MRGLWSQDFLKHGLRARYYLPCPKAVSQPVFPTPCEYDNISDGIAMLLAGTTIRYLGERNGTDYNKTHSTRVQRM
jgi:hypothetical protein